MDLLLRDKVVAVTGGSAGIGKAAALEFAREGCKLAICGRSKERLAEAKGELECLGSEVFVKCADVADAVSLKEFFDEMVSHFGELDVWVSNAATNLSKPVLECTLEDWDFVFNTNLRSAFYGDQLAATYMREHATKGVIINVSSLAAKIPVTAQPLYASAKAAMNSLTRSFAAECAPFGVRVLGISPGWTSTERGMISAKGLDMKTLLAEISLQRMAEPQEIAKPLVFLASEVCSYVTGTTMDVTGGKFSVQRPASAWPC